MFVIKAKNHLGLGDSLCGESLLLEEILALGHGSYSSSIHSNLENKIIDFQDTFFLVKEGKDPTIKPGNIDKTQ